MPKFTNKSSKNRARTRKERALAQNHLKTLTANSQSRHLLNAGRIVKYGTSSFTRNIWLSIAATLVMTITLIILSVTVFASVILSSTADAMRDKIDITVFFKSDTTETTLTKLSEILEQDSNVKSITISTAEQEYEKFLAENASEEMTAALEEQEMKDLMLSSMQAAMRIKVNDPDNLDSIKYTIENNESFLKYRDPDTLPTYDTDQTKIATITSWANIAKNGGLIIGAIFLIISILVIFNTIRMAIFSRREEIYMMKLVGADASFIRGPFLVEAQMYGIISGILASGLVLLGYKLLGPKLAGYGVDITVISNIMESGWLALVIIATILVGMFIGFVSARLAIRKYLK